MGEQDQPEGKGEKQSAVRICEQCPMGRYTRGSKKRTLFYRSARAIQRICPICQAANRTLGRDFQEPTAR